MRWVSIGVPVLIVAAMAALVAALIWSKPAAPPPLASIASPFRGLDYSDLPKPSSFVARDGTAISYYAYPGTGKDVAILVHGSSGAGSSMHALARALNAAGVAAYSLTMRGHPGSGRLGDIDYIGQLDDDLADFVHNLGPRANGERRTLIGFSSGAAFAMRIAGGEYGPLFDRFIFISPALVGTAALRSNAGGWASVALPRLIALRILSRFNMHSFDSLPVIAFAVAPDMARFQAPVYSYRLLTNFGPSDDFAADLKAAQQPMSVFVGAKDEVLVPSRLKEIIAKARPDIDVDIVPGIDHAGMITKPEAVNVVTALFR